MKHIELSRHIRLKNPSAKAGVQKALLMRLQRAFMQHGLDEYSGGFRFSGSTGARSSLIREARVDVDINIVQDGDSVRVFVHGGGRIAQSLVFAYCLLFLMVLLVGLLPGSINTGGDSSDAMDALVFLIFGIFIFYDMEHKLQAPGEYLKAALDSVADELN